MLFKVGTKVIDPQILSDHVSDPKNGAITSFLGVVRNHNNGRQVLYPEYDAYPEMAEQVMQDIAKQVIEQYTLTNVAIQHRIGRLEIGEISLAIAVSSPHRRESFTGCSEIVERIKEILPVWKKEVWEKLANSLRL